MFPNSTTTSRTTLLIRLAAGSSPKPIVTSRFIVKPNYNKVPTTNPIQRNCLSTSSGTFPFKFNGGSQFKHLGRSQTGIRLLGSGIFRSSAVSDGGSGGTGGGYGGSSKGGSDGKGEGGGGGGRSNWSLLSWYLSLLQKHPVLTKAVTSALLTFIGDVVCQVMIDQVSTVDLKRTLLFSFLGFALVGPALHFWYLYLSKLVTKTGASGAFLRLLLDQFLFSPVFIGAFLSALLTLEGKSSQVVPKLQQEWFSAVIANWQLWIPFQFLNFRFVPQQFQVLAANVIALIWNVILSYKAHKEVISK